MEIQPQLVLLQKTLLNIEGLGRQLYPELDLWQTGQPVLREWMAERNSPATMLKRFREELPEIRYMIDQLPAVARKLIDKANAEPPARPPRATMLRWAKRRYLAFSGALCLLGAVLLVGQQAQPVWLGWSLGALATALLIAGRPR